MGGGGGEGKGDKSVSENEVEFPSLLSQHVIVSTLIAIFFFFSFSLLLINKNLLYNFFLIDSFTISYDHPQLRSTSLVLLMMTIGPYTHSLLLLSDSSSPPPPDVS